MEGRKKKTLQLCLVSVGCVICANQKKKGTQWGKNGIGFFFFPVESLSL